MVRIIDYYLLVNQLVWTQEKISGARNADGVAAKVRIQNTIAL